MNCSYKIKTVPVQESGAEDCAEWRRQQVSAYEAEDDERRDGARRDQNEIVAVQFGADVIG